MSAHISVFTCSLVASYTFNLAMKESSINYEMAPQRVTAVRQTEDETSHERSQSHNKVYERRSPQLGGDGEDWGLDERLVAAAPAGSRPPGVRAAPRGNFFFTKMFGRCASPDFSCSCLAFRNRLAGLPVS